MTIKSLKSLPISDEQRNNAISRYLNLHLFGSINARIVKVTKHYFVVSIRRLVGCALTDDQLKSDIKAIFNDMLPLDYEIHTHVVKGNIDDVAAINHEWLSVKISENNIKARQLATMLNVDKTNLSSLLTGAREMTAWHKAAFYYFFKSLERVREQEKESVRKWRGAFGERKRVRKKESGAVFPSLVPPVGFVVLLV
jgi:hypothetical protein